MRSVRAPQLCAIAEKNDQFFQTLCFRMRSSDGICWRSHLPVETAIYRSRVRSASIIRRQRLVTAGHVRARPGSCSSSKERCEGDGTAVRKCHTLLPLRGSMNCCWRVPVFWLDALHRKEEIMSQVGLRASGWKLRHAPTRILRRSGGEAAAKSAFPGVCDDGEAMR